jgi:molybdate transport system ATP-binding protein
MGYVFQEASLFPHLSVRKNLEYGMRRTPAAERRVVFEEAVDLLGVAPMLNRKPDKLSGGERQRVAIARALLTSPRLLLMDEPMAALDSNSKADILPYLEKLHEELSIPVLYISHSLPEVMKLADHIFLMKDGQMIAAGPLQTVLARTDLPFMQAEDAGGVINATVQAHDPHYHLTTLRFKGGELVLPLLTLAIGASVRIRIPARDVSIALNHDQHSSILNILPATVVQTIQDDRGHYLVQLAIGEAFLLARISFKSKELLQLRAGLKVFAQVKSMALL